MFGNSAAEPGIWDAKSSGASAVLDVQDLCVRYGQIQAVSDLQLKVQEGELVALLGANGAGKSSTLRAIVGLVPAFAGRILFDGREITSLATEAIVKRGLTMVPEGRHLFRDLTVEENLRLGAATLERHGFDALLSEIVDLFPIARERRHTQAGLLSGGEQQQIAIARALLARPRVLLLDEPSLGLAPIIVNAVFDIIKALKKRRVTILLVEQNVERALSVADRAYVMASGRIEKSGAAGSLSSAEIEEAYLGISAAPGR